MSSPPAETGRGPHAGHRLDRRRRRSGLGVASPRMGRAASARVPRSAAARRDRPVRAGPWSARQHVAARSISPLASGQGPSAPRPVAAGHSAGPGRRAGRAGWPAVPRQRRPDRAVADRPSGRGSRVGRAPSAASGGASRSHSSRWLPRRRSPAAPGPAPPSAHRPVETTPAGKRPAWLAKARGPVLVQAASGAARRRGDGGRSVDRTAPLARSPRPVGREARPPATGGAFREAFAPIARPRTATDGRSDGTPAPAARATRPHRATRRHPTSAATRDEPGPQ